MGAREGFHARACLPEVLLPPDRMAGKSGDGVHLHACGARPRPW